MTALTLSSGGAYNSPQAFGVAIGSFRCLLQHSMVVKSHRQLRHEREHNELADWLAERLEVLRPYCDADRLGRGALDRRGCGRRAYITSARSGKWPRRSGRSYFAALNEREPEKVAARALLRGARFGGRLVGRCKTLGDINLAQGAALMFSDRTQAKEKLDEAEEFYKKAEAARTIRTSSPAPAGTGQGVRNAVQAGRSPQILQAGRRNAEGLGDRQSGRQSGEADGESARSGAARLVRAANAEEALSAAGRAAACRACRTICPIGRTSPCPADSVWITSARALPDAPEPSLPQPGTTPPSSHCRRRRPRSRAPDRKPPPDTKPE